MRRSESRIGFRGTITTLLVVTWVVAACTSALAVDKLIVQDATGTINKFVVTDTGSVNGIDIVSGKVGVGTATPATAVHTRGATFANTQVLSHAVGGADYTVSGGFLAYRNNNPAAGETLGLPKANDRIGYMLFGSYATDGVTARNAAGIASYAEKDWTNSTIPAYFLFELASDPPSPVGSGRVERMRINSAGNVGIGTKTPTERLEVNGGVRLNTVDPKPVICDASTRGTLWLEQGTTDILYICAQSGGAPGWRTVTLN